MVRYCPNDVHKALARREKFIQILMQSPRSKSKVIPAPSIPSLASTNAYVDTFHLLA